MTGLRQGAAAPVSSLQVNVDSGTVEVNENTAEVDEDTDAGLLVIAVSGTGSGVVTEAAAVRVETLPDVSRARTAYVWVLPASTVASV